MGVIINYYLLFTLLSSLSSCYLFGRTFTLTSGFTDYINILEQRAENGEITLFFPTFLHELKGAQVVAALNKESNPMLLDFRFNNATDELASITMTFNEEEHLKLSRKIVAPLGDRPCPISHEDSINRILARLHKLIYETRPYFRIDGTSTPSPDTGSDSDESSTLSRSSHSISSTASLRSAKSELSADSHLYQKHLSTYSEHNLMQFIIYCVCAYILTKPALGSYNYLAAAIAYYPEITSSARFHIH